VKRQKPPLVHEQPMTYEDYASLPDDGYRYELVDRKLQLMSPAPSTIHQLFVAQLRDTLNQCCESDYFMILSPVDLVLSDIDTRQPDLIMIHRTRMDIVKVRGIFGVPDLVVEVVSPGSFRRDRKEKLKTYSQYRVPEYWLIDPVNVTLEQYLFEGVELRLDTVFEQDEPIYSSRIPCVDWKMSDVIQAIPKITD
jgi:Uma2 family endonuclease